MDKAKEELRIELWSLRNDYASGGGNHGPALAELTQAVWLACNPDELVVEGKTEQPHKKEREDKKAEYKTEIEHRFKIALVMLIISVVALPADISPILAIVYVVGVGYMYRSDSRGLGKLTGAAIAAAIIVDQLIYVRFYGFIFCTASVMFFCKMKKEKQTVLNRTAENSRFESQADMEYKIAMEKWERDMAEWGAAQAELNERILEAQKSLKGLTDKIVEEFKEQQERLLDEWEISEEERESLRLRLPIRFWWNVSEEEVKREWYFEKNPDNSIDTTWRNFGMKKAMGREYPHAWEEKSLLCEESGDPDMDKMLYENDKRNVQAEDGIILDFFVRFRKSVVNVKNVINQHTEDVHSTSSQLMMEHLMQKTAVEIDEAHDRGEVSSDEYNRLEKEFRDTAFAMELEMNRTKTVEERRKEYHESSTEWDEWTGQILLVPGNDPGKYSIIDYRSRKEWKYKNLFWLAKHYRIDSIAGDGVAWDPYVLRTLSLICPDFGKEES